MLLDYGHMPVPEDWKVIEKTAPGYCRAYMVYGGEVTYTDEHVQKKLRSNTFYIFPSAAPYQMVQNPKNSLMCAHLHLDVFPVLTHRLIELPLAENPVLERLIAAIVETIDHKKQKLLASLCDCLLLYCREEEILVSPVLEISKLLHYIASHIQQGAIPIEELSGLMGYNPQYFIRLFRRSVGMTPHQYITNYRMSESIKLLRREEYTVSQIAELVGYPDAKAFGRAFREKYGISPSRFRKIDVVLP